MKSDKYSQTISFDHTDKGKLTVTVVPGTSEGTIAMKWDGNVKSFETVAIDPAGWGTDPDGNYVSLELNLVGSEKVTVSYVEDNTGPNSGTRWASNGDGGFRRSFDMNKYIKFLAGEDVSLNLAFTIYDPDGNKYDPKVKIKPPTTVE